MAPPWAMRKRETISLSERDSLFSEWVAAVASSTMAAFC